MKNLLRITAGVIGSLVFGVPLVFAEAASVSIQSLSPGTTVGARSLVTFRIVASGFPALSYQLSDSFGPSTTASADNINPGGNFSWVPEGIDAGTHTFTITVSDYSSDSASTMQTIVVLPPPSVSIQSVSPGTSIMPGNKFSFNVSAIGFSHPTYSVSDSFGGSTASSVSVDSSGNFSWTPDISQNGEHTITVDVYDSPGHSASASQKVRVGAGPTLSIQLLSSGSNVSIGTTTSFSVIPFNFSPTSFGISDNFPGTTISNNNITASGFFSWFPSGSDVGVHVLTIRGTVGAFGDSTTTQLTITVTGPGGAVPPVTASSNAVSGASIAELQAQLEALKAQIATQSGTSGSIAPSSVSTFSTYLHPGMQSDEVIHLQTVLSQQGFFSGTASGYYGPLTVDAVAKFQVAHGIAQLGVVGPATRAALNALQSGTPTSASTASSPSGNGYVFKNFIGLGEDSTDGTDVLELQKRLATLGFFSGEPSGYFGSATEAAVKKFQSAHGIPAVGYVGSATRAAINQ